MASWSVLWTTPMSHKSAVSSHSAKCSKLQPSVLGALADAPEVGTPAKGRPTEPFHGNRTRQQLQSKLEITHEHRRDATRALRIPTHIATRRTIYHIGRPPSARSDMRTSKSAHNPREAARLDPNVNALMPNTSASTRHDAHDSITLLRHIRKRPPLRPRSLWLRASTSGKPQPSPCVGRTKASPTW